VDVVYHVGSSTTGASIREATARTGAHAVLEGGGKDPCVVDAGVDPAWAAEQVALGAFANAGQICVSVERVYVHADVADAFLAALVEQAKGFEIGPLVDRRQREVVDNHVQEALAAGAEALAGGEVPTGPAPGTRRPCWSAAPTTWPSCRRRPSARSPRSGWSGPSTRRCPPPPGRRTDWPPRC
jgi:succinate-semialdehyde dehydrogenase/glutarate-semialdehyde dehydrogenase